MSLFVVGLALGACRHPREPESAAASAEETAATRTTASDRAETVPDAKAVDGPVVDPVAPEAEEVEVLVANIHGTEAYPDIEGTVRFRRLGRRVEVQTELVGLPDGDHAYHVHVFGDCSDPAGDSAGPHLDFEALGEPREGPPDHVTGDLGVIALGASGSASAETIVPRLRSEHLGELNGRAVVVHERGNDPSHPPDGDAGEPIACGVIGVAAPEGPERQPTGMPGPATTPGTPSGPIDLPGDGGPRDPVPPPPSRPTPDPRRP